MKQYLFLALLFFAGNSFGMEDCSRWGASVDAENTQSPTHCPSEINTIYKQLESLGNSRADLAQYVFLSAHLREVNHGSCAVQKKSNEAEQLDLREIRNNILNAQHELKNLEFFGDKPKLCAEKRAEIARLKELEKLT